MRQIYAILAGCVATSWRRFLLFNAIGATLWVGFWATLVLWFGRHLRHIWDAFKEHEVYVFLGVALIAALDAASCTYSDDRARRRKVGETPINL